MSAIGGPVSRLNTDQFWRREMTRVTKEIVKVQRQLKNVNPEIKSASAVRLDSLKSRLNLATQMVCAITPTQN